jgi:glycosyltransferase involved in cell wall biosynthesis
MNSDPLVSVVTPSYNQRRFVRDTLDSVRRQTYDSVEHVVVDGESTDGTVDFLREYDYDGLRWRSEPDDGQADAINTGFDRASGDVVGWLNSDDVYLDTGTLGRVVEHFERTEADVIYGNVAVVDAESVVRKLHLVPSFDRGRLLRYCFVDQPAVFFRAEVLEDERLDPAYEHAMDYEFWLRLSERFEFRHVPDLLAGDRNHANRKIVADSETTARESRRVREDYGGPDTGYRLFGRVRDVLTSGIPRRIRSIRQTLALHANPPTLAFDGSLAPRREMLVNVIRSNRSITADE